MSKECIKCEVTKPYSDFPLSYSKKYALDSPYAYRNDCKQCRKDYLNGYRDNNAKHITQVNQDYRDRNQGRWNGYKKEWREDNKEHISEYQTKHRRENRVRFQGVERLSNQYIKGLLSKHNTLKKSEVPETLVEVKRIYIQIQRELK